MIPHIINNIKNIFSINNKFAIAREVSVSSRIIDIVFLTIKNDNMIDESLIKKLKRLKISEQYVLSLMSEYGTFSIQRIAADIFSDYHDVKDKYITSFEKLEFIEQISRFRYKIIDELSDSLGELYAIEAKLSNWREAIEQAEDTKKFADYSYVAMDADFVNKRKDKLISEFSEKNIGLILVNNNGEVKKVVNSNGIRVKDKFESKLQQIRALQDFNSNKKWKVVH